MERNVKSKNQHRLSFEKIWSKEQRQEAEFNQLFKNRNKKYINLVNKFENDTDDTYWDEYDYWFYKYDHDD